MTTETEQRVWYFGVKQDEGTASPFSEDYDTFEAKLQRAIAKGLAAIYENLQKRLRRESRGEKHLPGKHVQKTHGHPKWGGDVFGATSKQEADIRAALGEVPGELLPKGMSVSVQTGMGVQVTQAGRTRIARSYWDADKKQIVLDSELLEFRRVAIHEAGHAVDPLLRIDSIGRPLPVKIGKMTGRSPFKKAAKELDVVSDYAKLNREEAWAEGFTSRIIVGTSFGPASEAVFTEMGI